MLYHYIDEHASKHSFCVLVFLIVSLVHGSERTVYTSVAGVVQDIHRPLLMLLWMMVIVCVIMISIVFIMAWCLEHVLRNTC